MVKSKLISKDVGVIKRKGMITIQQKPLFKQQGLKQIFLTTKDFNKINKFVTSKPKKRKVKRKRRK